MDINIKKSCKDIQIKKPITIKELAKLLSFKAYSLCEYINKIKLYKDIKCINDILEIENIQIILQKLGYNIKFKNFPKSINDIILNFNNRYNNLKKFPKIPIVSFLGHVDHGKTTLLDYIRSSNIHENEVGKITQKIGAYSVNTKNGYITFLDTPGHAIFNLMRLRGIKISDIIIIIIAADDGIKPQTIEVIKNSVKFKLPIIVAINKIELVDKKIITHITNELLNYQIIPESLGGDTFVIPISAKSGAGVNKLLETIFVQRDILELTSSKEGMVIATVIESSVDKHLGPLASILIENGTLHKGDIVVGSNIYGKIKQIRDEYFKNINVGYPSIPIQIIGLSGPPIVGEKLISVNTYKEAKEIMSFNKKDYRLNNVLNPINTDNINIFNTLKQSLKIIPLIIKTDSFGTSEVILNYFLSLNKKHKDKILFKIIHIGIGDINETDVRLAAGSHIKLIGFNIGLDQQVKPIISNLKIDIKIYNIIYTLIKDIKSEYLDSFLETKVFNKKPILGVAVVKNIYRSIKSRKQENIILGCKIIEGVFKKDSFIKIYREDKLIFKGTLNSLRRFKNDVNEVIAPMECGISINNCNNITEGDIVKTF